MTHPLRVLIGCEESGVVRRAFAAGHSPASRLQWPRNGAAMQQHQKGQSNG